MAAEPCGINNSRGDCEQQCQPVGNQYQCLCLNGSYLGPDLHSCFPPDVECNCKHGVCRGGGVCECVVGWKGETCAEASCHVQDECSGNGHCVRPGVCACNIRWGGPACNEDLCADIRICKDCTKQVGCGWCDDQQRCIAGSGEGPRSDQCRSWFYYACRGAVVSLRENPTNFSSVTILDCSRKCRDYKNLRTQGFGSYQYCSEYKRLCVKYASCFERAGDRITWREDKCRFGVVGLTKEMESVMAQSVANRSSRQAAENHCVGKIRYVHLISCRVCVTAVIENIN